MKWIIVIIVVLVVLVAILYLVGSFMPVKHTSLHSITLKASPEKVWNLLTDHKGYEQWRRDVKSVEIIDSRHWIEKSTNGTIEYESEIVQPVTKLVSTIVSKDLPFGGHWVYVLEPAPAGTKLTITENGEVYNPIFRFMSKYVFGHESTLRNYAADLEKRINTN